MLDPAAVDAPVVDGHAALGNILVQLWPGVRGPDPPEIHAQRRPQPFVVARVQAVVGLEPPVDSGVAM